MQVSASTLVLGAVVLAAAAYAFLAPSPAPPPEAPRALDPPTEVHPDESMPELPSEDPDETDPGSAEAEDVAPDDEPATIEWSVPAAWKTVPNPSAMRIATYVVPRAAGDTSDAEVSVVRAGGDEASNVQRWASQFAGAAPKLRTLKVRGLGVTVVELEGAYTNTTAPSAAVEPRWALLAAIVKAPGQPYFFKMTGPVATVHRARPAFVKLVESVQTAE